MFDNGSLFPKNQQGLQRRNACVVDHKIFVYVRYPNA